MASQVTGATTKPATIPLPRRDSSFLVLSPAQSPVEIQRRDSSFLSLAPVSSDSFPHAAPGRYSQPGSAMITPLSNSNEKALSHSVAPLRLPSPPSAQELEERVKTRRSSSVDSAGSAQRRFLKLGPVHFGGEAGVPDFCEH